MSKAETDYQIWLAARKALELHFPGGVPVKLENIPDGILQQLPRLCCWQSGLPRTFDQFRRRFERSHERALLWNLFFCEALIHNSATSDEARKRWLAYRAGRLQTVSYEELMAKYNR